MMTPHHQTFIISELARLESLGYMGLLGTKFLSDNLTRPFVLSLHRCLEIAFCGLSGQPVREERVGLASWCRDPRLLVEVVLVPLSLITGVLSSCPRRFGIRA